MDGARRRREPAVDVRLLGPTEAWLGEAQLAVGGPKPRALLALLALAAGRVVSVDQLVESMWPGEPPETATHAIQVYVSQLRKAFGDAIDRRGPGYVLDLSPEDVDVHRFARIAADGHEELNGANAAAAAGTLREALALWRGPALADFVYEPFAQTEIARLDDLRFSALEDRIAADLALGRHAELVAEVEALVEAQPLRERPRALLMRALYLAGRQADALSAYRVAREMLVEELGIEPGPELRELEAAILRQDESLVPAAAASRPEIRTRRLAAVLSVGLRESEAVDIEVEDRELEEAASTVIASVTRHGGIAERLADGSVTAVFGVPVAHEDDPLRAARAAVEAREALAAGSVALTAAIEVGEVVAAERTASGPPVRAAASLRQEAGAGEILVSTSAARHIGHAATLDSRGDTSSLVELAEDATAFERRRDTPLVGRKRELATLRSALKRARSDGSTRAAVIIGPPGVGKSRLAAELTGRTRGVWTLRGRCLSYGDGITYWPLREMLGQAAASAEREAVLDALDAETPPPAPEVALLFRLLCEKLASTKPLVLVFDDLHWAEPTLLDLVEHVATRGQGAILIVGVAREELLEDRPAFLESSADLLQLEGLSSEETESLLDSLDGALLEPGQRVGIVAAADGNPFFVEQLVALAREGGLGEHPLPETVQALLAARLDRLGPGERAVLERGSVVGREFTSGDVIALLEPAAVATARAHLETLSDRGFLRPHGGEAFGFRHALVQEAVYRSAPKRLRAELHERFADRLDDSYSHIPDLDEFVGYHLERAFRLHEDLGQSDRRAAHLAEQAGMRLGDAGYRALKRGDIPATVKLLARATSLLPAKSALRLDLLSELAIARRAAGDADAAREALSSAVADAQEANERRSELRARIEAAYLDLLTESEPGTARRLLDLAQDAVPMFEALGDDRSLSRAWLLIGYVRGGIRGDHSAWEEAERRALVHYRRISFPPATCLGQIAEALYWGPTPVPEAIEKCNELLSEASLGRTGRAAVAPFIGGLEAQRGAFAQARKLIAEAEAIYDELGWVEAAAIQCGTALADIELLAEDHLAAEHTLREQCDFFEKTGDRSHLAVRAAKLAEALLRQERLEEAERYAAVSRANAAREDQSVQLVLQPVEAKLLERRGQRAEARDLAQAAVQLGDSTDGLNQRANARLVLAEVLRADGLVEEAGRALAEAVRLFESKGNVVSAARARTSIEELALVEADARPT